ncbi:aldose 1-epimerase [Mycoplana sp. BE70]|uniref:aldose 1-epimerase n=1 Tax=Mycoplana sp. BE70 TaxID=2817775 RepID=UPI00285C0038|nr:aldose 1-epimerase [Mycoplana sp. BE70]MDR6757107.1 aldose 1-epimerase [Mycoplana sp. BE70]
MKRLDLTYGALTLQLAPASGGAVAGLQLSRGKERFSLLRPLPEGATDALHAAMFPMLPFANCLRDNRFDFQGLQFEVAPNMGGSRLNFHGSGWRLPWRVERSDRKSATLSLETDDGIWRYRAEQHFELGEQGLRVCINITNRGEHAMPFSLGLHPWFPRHGIAHVGFDASGFWRLTPDGETLALDLVPDEADHSTPRAFPRRAFNNCYEGWSRIARINWPAIGIGVELLADPVFGRLMVYSPAEDPETFCLEPQTCAPCGFDWLDEDPARGGAHILAPGETLSGGFTLGIIHTALETSGNEN